MKINIQNKFSPIHSLLNFSSLFFLISVLTLFDSSDLIAQTRLHGVLQNYLAAQTTNDHEFIASRNRLRFQFEKSLDFGALHTELDLIQNLEDPIDVDLLLREAYFDWYLNKVDLRIGHQKILWGRANGTFVTDIITPVDVREFLTVSAEDLRFGNTSFNAIRYLGANSLQFVLSPFFQPNLLPPSDSRWFPAHQLSSSFSPFEIETTRENDPYTIKDIQFAFRYSLLAPQKIDLDLFLMRWTHPTPAYNLSFDLAKFPNIRPIEFVESYKNSWMVGMSGSLKISPKIFLLSEALFVKDKLFTSLPFEAESVSDLSDQETLLDFAQEIEIGDDFLTTRPWLHSMTGIRTEIKKTTIEAQFFVEYIFDHEDQILNDEIFQYISLLAARSFLRDRLQLLSLSRYNIDSEDYWIQLQGQYELDENLMLTVGTHLFGGEQTNDISGQLDFSQFRENSFIFSKIALFF